MSGSDDVRRRDNMRHFQGKDAIGPMTNRVVPPDPPAADHDELARAGRCRDMHDCRPSETPCEACRSWADALLSSGVLVDAADVRARAWRWAASFGTMPGKSWPETLRYHAEHGAQYDRDEPAYFDEHAVSERDRGTT